LKRFDEDSAANDEFLSIAGSANAGELIWDLLQHRIKTPKRLPAAIRVARLQERFNRVLQNDGVLHIEAPAGFGKSQILSHALAGQPAESVSWITLTAQDNDPVRLLALLILALKRPELRHESLSKPVAGSLTDALSLLLARFCPESHPNNSLSLVLDGVDLLVTAPAVAMLRQLMEEMPEGLSLALISRQPLPVETHRYVLEGRFQHVTAEQIELTRPETLAFFEGDQATLHTAEHLYTLTEGWLTPLALYRSELQDNERERLPIQETQSVQRFLQDALFSPLTPGQQRALCVMAEFDVISDDLFLNLADADTDRTFCPSVAARRGIPLRPVAGRGRWFRFNPLARDWLQTKSITGCQHRARIASEWFRVRGDYSDALRYALVSQDTEQALVIASAGSEALLINQDTISLLGLRTTLPADLFWSSTRLRMVYGCVHAIGGQFHEARKLINSLPEAKVAQLEGRVEALEAFVLRGEGHVERSLAAADKALEEDSLNVHARFMSLQVRSSALCSAGRFIEARCANRKAGRLARETGDSGFEMQAIYEHARIELGKGHLKRAEQLLIHGLDTGLSDRARPPRIGEGRLQLGLALVFWHQGRTIEAARLLVQYVRHAEQSRDLGLLVIMALRTLIAKAGGAIDEAFAWIGQAERTMQLWHVDDAAYEPVLEALKATSWLSRGDYDSAGAALAVVQRYREQGREPELFSMLPGLADTLKLRHALGENRGEAARAEIEQIRAGHAASLGVQLYSGLLDGLAQFQCGKRDKAQARIRAVIDKAADEHYLSPFMELRYELNTLMRTLLPTTPDTAFVRALKGLFGFDVTSGGEENGPGELANPISEREQGVLELIAQGLSNQDIGDRLHISLHTVKTHARRINAKLEVKSRTQAIVKARQLGLL
jgi:LuxR family maltose regulon positive regulatory protein